MSAGEWWQEQSTAVKAFTVVVIVGGLLFFVVPIVGSFVLGIQAETAKSHSPTISVDASYDAETREVTLRHDGGEPLDPDRVTVRVGNDRVEQWPADGSIRAGDELTLEDVEAGTEIRVVWHAPDGEKALLGTVTVE